MVTLKKGSKRGDNNKRLPKHDHRKGTDTQKVLSKETATKSVCQRNDCFKGDDAQKEMITISVSPKMIVGKVLYRSHRSNHHRYSGIPLAVRGTRGTWFPYRVVRGSLTAVQAVQQYTRVLARPHIAHTHGKNVRARARSIQACNGAPSPLLRCSLQAHRCFLLPLRDGCPLYYRLLLTAIVITLVIEYLTQASIFFPPHLASSLLDNVAEA